MKQNILRRYSKTVLIVQEEAERIVQAQDQGVDVWWIPLSQSEDEDDEDPL